MMRMLITILAILLLAGCSGRGPAPLGSVELRLLEETAAHSVSLQRNGSELQLSFRPERTGAFVELEPGFDARFFEEQWAGDAGTVHLVVTHAGRLQIGVVPTADYAGQPVSLRLSQGSTDRTASKPPLGNANSVNDLTAVDLGNGTVRLEWTQLNVGDYDQNGVVAISDITPLGINLGRQGPWQPTEVPFWVDGDRNGSITISDITPLGVNFGNAISGYNIFRVDGTEPPPLGMLAFAAAEEALQSPGLPRRYSVIVDSPPEGTFIVRPVDSEGLEGVDSQPASLSSSTPSLELDLDIVGQMLYEQNSGLPANFNNDTVILRIIEDIEEVNGAEIGTFLPLAEGQFAVSGLPRGKALFLQIAYEPTVDLATGGAKAPSSKGSSSIRSVSDIPAGADVTTIPFRLPQGEEPVSLTTLIDLGNPNPDGGFFVRLDDSQTIPGDNPATPGIENGYTLVRDLQLDYVNMLLSGDTDDDDDFSLEPSLRDPDRDCLSDKRGEQVLDDDDEYENRPEIEIEGTVTGFDEANGLIFLTDAFIEIGETEKPLPSDVIVYFTEFTPFWEDYRDDFSDPDEYRIDPEVILAGDILKIDMYALEDSGEILPTKYWVEKVTRDVDLRTDD